MVKHVPVVKHVPYPVEKIVHVPVEKIVSIMNIHYLKNKIMKAICTYIYHKQYKNS